MKKGHISECRLEFARHSEANWRREGGDGVPQGTGEKHEKGKGKVKKQIVFLSQSSSQRGKEGLVKGTRPTR